MTNNFLWLHVNIDGFSLQILLDTKDNKHDPSAIQLANADLTTIAKAKEEVIMKETIRGEHWVCARCVKFVTDSEYQDRYDKIIQHLVDV